MYHEGSFVVVFFFFIFRVPFFCLPRQVSLEDEEESSRSLLAAAAVDRAMDPENFVLMVEHNPFGPINAVLSGVRRL